MYIFVAINLNKIKYNMADNIDKEFEHHDKVFSIFLDSLFSSGDPKDKDKDKEKDKDNDNTIPWGRKPQWEDDDENPLFI